MDLLSSIQAKRAMVIESLPEEGGDREEAAVADEEAEVVIEFDNSTKIFPINDNVVKITMQESIELNKENFHKLLKTFNNKISILTL